MPRGVDFISANEDVHFSSVLALHRAYRRAQLVLSGGSVHVIEPSVATRGMLLPNAASQIPPVPSAVSGRIDEMPAPVGTSTGTR